MISAAERHELESLIDAIEFLDQQMTRVEASLTQHETELAEQEQTLGHMIGIAHQRLQRMRGNRESKIMQLSERLKVLRLSFVHHGKVYVPANGTVVVMPVSDTKHVEPGPL